MKLKLKAMTPERKEEIRTFHIPRNSWHDDGECYVCELLAALDEAEKAQGVLEQKYIDFMNRELLAREVIEAARQLKHAIGDARTEHDGDCFSGKCSGCRVDETDDVLEEALKRHDEGMKE